MTRPSDIPEEITTPPEGYEWTGEMRSPKDGEVYASWLGDHWSVISPIFYRYGDRPNPILRKIQSPTVMVELPRGAANHAAVVWTDAEKTLGAYSEPWLYEIGKAARKALEGEA